MNTSRVLLALDLSTPRGAIAVVRGSDVLFEANFTAHRSHNAQLFEPLRAGLRAAGEELAGIVIGTGPGSYTGVRIAIAAAQGVSMSRNVPVMRAPSLLAPAAAGNRQDFCIVGDARRDSSFAAVVRTGKLAVEGIQLMPTPELESWSKGHHDLPLFTFDEPTSKVVAATFTHPCPIRLAETAMREMDGGQAQYAAEKLEPIYLREAFITVAKPRATRL